METPEDQQIAEARSNLAPLLFQQMGFNPAMAPNDRGSKRSKPDPSMQMAPGAAQSSMFQVLQLMGKLLLRHEQEINTWKHQDSYIIHLTKEPRGLLPLMIQTATEWQTANSANPRLAGHLPLKVKLTQTIFQELLQRFAKVMQAQKEDPLVKQLHSQKVLLPDGTWPYLKWDPTSPTLVMDDAKTPVAVTSMRQGLE